ncbi:hypothetical protein GY45DRAFT_460793 [Cubamyces sp. BRFM 1775]|nr:hypothetical protein GY45DRAFT_460793 [Cubamyces sp. BRFM 1775]
MHWRPSVFRFPSIAGLSPILARIIHTPHPTIISISVTAISISLSIVPRSRSHPHILPRLLTALIVKIAFDRTYIPPLPPPSHLSRLPPQLPKFTLSISCLGRPQIL